MNKLTLCALVMVLAMQNVLADDTVFDSMDKATEVKLAPAIKTSKPQAQTTKVNTVYKTTTVPTSIKEQKFNSALVNLDDAKVELRQELANTTAQYNEAMNEKERIIAHCKSLKKEIKEINKKMKNVDKSKKMINKNLDSNNQ